MPHLSIKGRTPAALAALPIMLLACGGLAACGSSSSSTSTQAAAKAASATTAGTTSSVPTPAPAPAGTQSTGTPAGVPPSGATGPTGPRGARFAAVRECLQKNGVTLPKRPAGARPGAGGLPGGTGGAGGPGAQQLPKGMTEAQYRAVLEKCGAGFRGPGAFDGRHSFDSSGFRTALANFASCLRQAGVNLPTPNTSGKGPVFDTKGIDTSSPKFKAAEAKCRSVLLAGLRHRAGAGATSGAPGSSG
jgi:hypothetical protein